METLPKLTAIQATVLNEIKESIALNGHPPTRKELAIRLGWRSANTAEEHIKALERKGYLKVMPKVSRGVQLTDVVMKSIKGLPLLGHVAAGAPIFAPEHVQKYCNIPSHLFQPKADYLLKVTGMSMKDAGILEGDWLAVHRTLELPKNGQIVVARLHDEMTVKRFKRINEFQVALMPDNDDYNTIFIDLHRQSLEIDGVVVGLIRIGI